MKINKSIKRRVFLTFGGFTLLLAFLYSALTVFVAYIVEDELLHKLVASEAEYIEQNFHQQGRIVSPRVDYMTLYEDVSQTPQVIRETLQLWPDDNEIFTFDNKHYHIQYLYFDKQRSPLLVAEVSQFLIVSNLSKVLWVLFGLVLVLALCLAVWMAWRIARRTTEPVLILTEEVMAQREQVQPLALSASQTQDEIGYLAETIEQALNDYKCAVQRESDFTRDVSHELRTPLTVIKNTLALAEQRQITADDRAQLHDSVAIMDHTVAILLALARAESVAMASFAFRELLEESILALHHKLSEADFNITLNVPDNYRLNSNRQLVCLLINNLIENAVAHGAGSEMRISLVGNQCRFENTTINQPNANITDPQVKQANSEGLGQGLYLVKRIVETLGWHFSITFENSLYCFAVDFPPED